jgi:ribosomal protein S18 acetylase RimI-like enzyme
VAGVRLGRLAVSKDHHGRGLGKILLLAAMKKFLEVFRMAGGIGLFVDAKDHQAKAFYEHFGFVPLPSNELQLFLPVATIQEALAEEG